MGHAKRHSVLKIVPSPLGVKRQTKYLNKNTSKCAYTTLSCIPGFGRPGGYGEGSPPDPISNSAVKTLSADGTAS